MLYDIYYRVKGNKNNQVFCCSGYYKNKKEARINFNYFDNPNKIYTVVKINKA